MIRRDKSSETFTLKCVDEERKSDGLYVLDYGAGNVRSLYNATRKIGYRPKKVESPQDIDKAKKLIFPGVGSFGSAMKFLKEKGYFEPLRRYLLSENHFEFVSACKRCFQVARRVRERKVLELLMMI